MRFFYGRYEMVSLPNHPEGTDVYRPTIPVRLIGNIGEATFFGLVDTGADATCISREMANMIGVTPMYNGTEFQAFGVGGPMPITYGVVTIEVEQGIESYVWHEAVGIIDEPLAEPVLGNIGFLQYFDATFRPDCVLLELIRNTVPLPSLPT